MKPYVTVAIPFYNAEKYLADAIRSIMVQSYKNWELILIDDGSSDGSLSIAQSIVDPRVRVIHDGKNKKLAARLNEVARLAKYDYLVRMDADDLIATDRIERQMDILLADETLDLVTTGVVSITDELEYIGHRGQNALCPTLHQLITKEIGVTHAAIVGRKSWFLRNPYDESLKVAQDFSLWISAAAKGDFNIKIIETPLYYYREEGNVSAVKMLKAYKYERKIILKYIYGSQKIKLWIKATLKSMLVTILSAFGLMYLLLQKRATIKSDVNVINRLNADVLSIRNIKLIIKSES
jgi:glycosyltransferase involved in cell wall biosynthesis